MLQIVASRLRKADKRLQALKTLFEKMASKSYTLIGNEPSDYAWDRRHPPQSTWLTYDESIKQYVMLYQQLDPDSYLPVVAVVIDRVTLIFDHGLLRSGRLCAVLLKPPLATETRDWYTRPSRQYCLKSLIEHVTPHYVWDYLERFDAELKAGGFIAMASYTDEELRKIPVDQIHLLAMMALAKD